MKDPYRVESPDPEYARMRLENRLLRSRLDRIPPAGRTEGWGFAVFTLVLVAELVRMWK